MKCKYCNKECSGTFCDDRCRTKYEEYKEVEEKNGSKMVRYLIVSIVIGVILASLLLFVDESYIEYCFLLMFTPMCLVMIVFPFANEETQMLWGVEKSLTVVRASGIAIIIISFIFGIVM